MGAFLSKNQHQTRYHTVLPIKLWVSPSVNSVGEQLVRAFGKLECAVDIGNISSTSIELAHDYANVILCSCMSFNGNVPYLQGFVDAAKSLGTVVVFLVEKTLYEKDKDIANVLNHAPDNIVIFKDKFEENGIDSAQAEKLAKAIAQAVNEKK